MRAPCFVLLLLAAACGGSTGPAAQPDGGGGGDGGGSARADAASDARGPADGGGGSAVATIRVHYPAGHAIAIRGSGGGLSWDMGAATTAAGDTFTLALPALAQTIEWKPLLDDDATSGWARGPNYHLAPGQQLDVYPHFTATAGRVEVLDAAFRSATLGNDRAIYAYLPASYAENPDATYPVVYLHDGQNLWAAMPELAFSGTWNVDTAFDAAAETGACGGWGAQPLGGAAATCTGDGDCAAGVPCETFPEAIAIGVANTDQRIFEYTPTTDPTTPGGGGADGYLTMLVTELKPMIDAQLRTRPDAASTALVGSSLGGLVTAYAGATHADVFSRLGELSPSTWWNTDVIVGDVAAAGSASPRPAIVYVDSGAGDADDESDTDQLAQTYLGSAYGYVDGVTFRHVVQPGAAHSETYWAERLPGALQLLLGAR